MSAVTGFQLEASVCACAPIHHLCVCVCVCLGSCSSDEPRTKLPQKVSASLVQALDKLEISNRAELEQKGLSGDTFSAAAINDMFPE